MSEKENNLIKITKHTICEYDIYLDDNVTDIQAYHEIAHVLNQSKEQERVTLHLANFGGSCHGCIYLINYIRGSLAPVIASISGPCYSAGSTLALACDGIEIKPNTFLMFHNYSSFTGGKGDELLMSVEQTNKWIHQYFRDIHAPFLSKAELKKIEKDQDIYIHHNDPTLQDRCERHYKRKR